MTAMTKIFITRTTRPENYDPLWTRTASGGKSPCIKGVPAAWPGSVLSNCVGYCYGRVAELNNGHILRIGHPSTIDYPLDAQNWFTARDGLERGSVPKLGAVACWKRRDLRSGHVAMVEKINADGGWMSSESSYKGSAFRNKTYNRNSYKFNYIFQGFIYPPYVDEYVVEPELKVGDTVIITGPYCANSLGLGKKYSAAVGWTRQILQIYPGRSYPYRVGYGSTTVGFFKKESLEKKE